MGRPAIPFMPLIDQHVFQTAVLKRSAPRTLLISRFHVKHAPHCVGIASAQSGLRCTVSSVILMLRCGGGCIHNPSEGVKPPAAWLRAEHRHSAHATRCTTTSVLRIGTRAGPSRRTHRSGTDGTVPPPGGGLSIPFPRAGIDPTSVDVTSAGRISTRMVLRRLAAVSRETGSQPPPRSAPHLPLQSGGARRDFRILCPSPMHGNLISTCQSRCIFHTLPSQHNAFHPIGRDLLDGRPPVSI